jgi:hypothetical protein
LWIRPVCESGRTHWEGWTEAAQPSVTPDTRFEDDREVAVMQIAGWMAERIFDAANFRAGSSIDEVITAGRIARMIAVKTKREPTEVWAEILLNTEMRLRAHEPIVRAIADELRRKRRINARRLRVHLRPVLQATGGRDAR